MSQATFLNCINIEKLMDSFDHLPDYAYLSTLEKKIHFNFFG